MPARSPLPDAGSDDSFRVLAQTSAPSGKTTGRERSFSAQASASRAATPPTLPAIAVQPSGGGVTVEASRNGATDDASWQLRFGGRQLARPHRGASAQTPVRDDPPRGDERESGRRPGDRRERAPTRQSSTRQCRVREALGSLTRTKRLTPHRRAKRQVKDAVTKVGVFTASAREDPKDVVSVATVTENTASRRQAKLAHIQLQVEHGSLTIRK
jgi:hypothetical protein